MIGIVGADFKFMWVDVCDNGSTLDCIVCNRRNLREDLENDTLGLPDADEILGDD